MSAEETVEDLYAEPFYQTLILTQGPLDAVASRNIVDLAAQGQGETSHRMTMMAPLRERVSVPDWKPETLSAALGIATEIEPGEVPPLEAVTGGPDATADELKARMHQQIELGIEKLDQAKAALAADNSLYNARAFLQQALSAWTLAEMINVRLYTIQFGLDQRKAAQDVDRG